MASLEEAMRRLVEENNALRMRIEQAEARTEQAEAQTAPTCFLDYIRNTEEHLYASFYLRKVPTVATAKATVVTGKFYPRHLRRWDGFAERHRTTFEKLSTLFGEQALFPSLANVKGASTYIVSEPANERDLEPFIYAAIERPAQDALQQYLVLGGHPTYTEFAFQNNVYSLGNREDVTEYETGLETRLGIPDRWGRASVGNDMSIRVLVGEYKAAQKMRHKKLQRVLGPSSALEGLFDRAVRNKDKESASDAASDAASNAGSDAVSDAISDAASEAASEAASDVASQTRPYTRALTRSRSRAQSRARARVRSRPRTRAAIRAASRATSRAASVASEAQNAENKTPGFVMIAKVLCQEYHYMICSGLEFGYVASGDSLIFLQVLEDDPQTLYYHMGNFPVPDIKDKEERQVANRGMRAPPDTATAHMLSLGMWALHSNVRPPSWVDQRHSDLARWPMPYDQFLQSPATLNPPAAHNRNQQTGDGGGRGGGAVHARQHFVVEPPTLPYCSQACLRGLCRGLPLDEGCPNVALHRAAQTQGADSHPLTAAAVRARVVAQLAENMDRDCECMDKNGCFGRRGVLFRLTVTGYGYTLAAKAVRAMHRSILEHEVKIYTALAKFQGSLIPVCLGLVDLARPLPLGGIERASHFMLLSYAGPTLNLPASRLPEGVDAEEETVRTALELEAAGLWNEDVEGRNLAWNDEAQRMMELDFDMADVDALERRKKKEEEKLRARNEKTAAKQLPSRAPLEAKRDVNAYLDGDSQGAKRTPKSIPPARPRQPGKRRSVAKRRRLAK